MSATDTLEDSKNTEIPYCYNVELSGLELQCIGHIVAQWGALESEIFLQTFETLDAHTGTLPKEMNNLQPSAVLALWKERVVDQCSGEKKKHLEEQHALVQKYAEWRNALVHGMWDWDRTSPNKILTTRVRKKELLSHHFTAADLQHLSLELAKLNFNVRYTTKTEFVSELMDSGGHMGRLTASLLSGNRVAGDLIADLGVSKEALAEALVEQKSEGHAA